VIASKYTGTHGASNSAMTPLLARNARSEPMSRRTSASPERAGCAARCNEARNAMGDNCRSSRAPAHDSARERTTSMPYASASASTTSTLSIVSVSRLRLANTRSNTCIMNTAGIISIRLSTRLAPAASRTKGRSVFTNSQRMFGFSRRID
jgi:hypothetical protein